MIKTNRKKGICIISINKRVFARKIIPECCWTSLLISKIVDIKKWKLGRKKKRKKEKSKIKEQASTWKRDQLHCARVLNGYESSVNSSLIYNLINDSSARLLFSFSAWLVNDYHNSMALTRTRAILNTLIITLEISDILAFVIDWYKSYSLSIRW